MSEEPKQNEGRVLVDRKLVEAPSNFIVSRPRQHFCFVLSPLSCSFFIIFPCSLLLLCLLCLFVLYKILALWPPTLQYQQPALRFVFVLFVLFLLFVAVLYGEPKQNQGRRLVDGKLVKAPAPTPSKFIDGRPKAAPLY